MRRLIRTVLLVLGFLSLAAFKFSCGAYTVDNSGYPDRMVALGRTWIVTASGLTWNFTPVPGSGNTAPVVQMNAHDLFARPGGPCSAVVAGTPGLAGEPQVQLDPVDNRFWWHINTWGRYGCLFASVGDDPRGPYIGGWRTELADGLGLTVTRDKVMLAGYTCAIGTDPGCSSANVYIYNRGDLIANSATPRRVTWAIPTPTYLPPGSAPFPHLVYNRNSSDTMPGYLWMDGGSDGTWTYIRLVRFDALAANNTLPISWWDFPVAPSSWFQVDPGAYSMPQPDGSQVIFPGTSSGVWDDFDNMYIANTMAGDKHLHLMKFYNLSTTPKFGGMQIVRGPLSQGMGCLSIAVRPSDGHVLLGVTAADSTTWLSPYLREIDWVSSTAIFGPWFHAGVRGTGPTSRAPDMTVERLDYCASATNSQVYPTTTCHAQAVFFKGGYPLTSVFCME